MRNDRYVYIIRSYVCQALVGGKFGDSGLRFESFGLHCAPLNLRSEA